MPIPDLLSRCVLGTAALGGVWGKIDVEESIRTIQMALENGVACIDTAPAYGDAEELVGIALRQWKGAMPILSTKVGRLKTYAADQGVYDFGAEMTDRSVKKSLDTLGVSKVDILFLHDPTAMAENEIENVFSELLKFKAKGYAMKLGLGGNITENFMKHNLSGIFDVAMEYNRLDACCWDALGTTLPFYQSRGMEYYVASPLHMGLLGRKFKEFSVSPPAWLEKHSVEKAMQVNMIAEKHRLPLRSLATRFLLSLNGEFKIVIGPTDSSELHETILDFREGPLPDYIVDEIMN